MWIFQLNLICSYHGYCDYCVYFHFLRGATVNGVNQFWMLWMPCSYVCVNGLSLAVQESHRSSPWKEVPRVEGSSWMLVAQSVWMVCSVSFHVFCSISCKEPHRPDLLANTQYTFLFSLSLSDIGLPPCISVSGLLCQLFMFCRSRCEQGPIPIFLVMLLNRSCLFLLSFPVLYKILHFCCFSSVEASSPWEYCAHMGFFIGNCKLSLMCQLGDIFNKGCVNRESGNCGFSFGYSWSRVFQACTACDINNKKVLLCERKRHTDRHVASTRYAAPGGGRGVPWAGPPPSPGWGIPQGGPPT